MPRFIVGFMVFLAVHSAWGKPVRVPDPQLLPCHWLLAIRGDFGSARRIETIRDLYDNPLDIHEISLTRNHAVIRTGGHTARGFLPPYGGFRDFLDVWEISPRHFLLATVPLSDQTERVLPVSLSEDGELLAYPSPGALIHVEDLKTVSVTNLIPRHTLDLTTPGLQPGSHATALMFRPGRSLVVGRQDGTLWLLNTAAVEPPYPIAGEHRGPIVALAQAAGSQVFAVASLSSGPFGEVRLHYGNADISFDLRHRYPTAVAVSERMRQVAVISAGGWLEFFSFEGERGTESRVDPAMLRSAGVDPQIFQKPGAFRFESRDSALVLSSSVEATGLVWTLGGDGPTAVVLGGLVAR